MIRPSVPVLVVVEVMEPLWGRKPVFPKQNGILWMVQDDVDNFPPARAGGAFLSGVWSKVSGPVRSVHSRFHPT
ncbi:hypothetical protein GCM10022380_42890 [Amycolatopsis tucumanensis]|uniref:Uncharacterized protein n=1 Tax=Amycolatopsis tucumanensis TaxID=401106 RepID=A0ABP7IIK5_9PSEU